MIIANSSLNYRDQRSYQKINFGRKSSSANFKNLNSFNNDIFYRQPSLTSPGSKIQKPTNSKVIIPENYDTVDGYDSCSESVKETLRKKFIENCSAKLPKYPLLKEDNMDDLVDTSRFLSRIYPKDRLVSVGRSPLWILEAGKLSNKIKEYTYAAFSGSWAFNSYTGIDEWKPDSEYMNHYRRYLEKIEVDPETIVKKLKESGQKTILIDLIANGHGINSFIQVVSDWAKEIDKTREGFFKDFQEAVGVNVITSNVSVRYNHPEFKTMRQKIDMSLFQALLLHGDHLDNSLGVHYCWNEWPYTDPLKAEPSENARLMKFWVIDHLAKNNLLKRL